MPFTPYHFGPSAFIGLALKKYIDIPVFVLANFIVDIEVLVYRNWPYHRYAHTLLIGAAVGILWGVAAYPLQPLFKKIMLLFRLPYKTTFLKMIVSGVFGVWLHVATDGIYHWDIRMFWPSKARPLWRLVSEGQVKTICLAFFIAAAILYIFIVKARVKQNRKSTR